MKSRVMIGVLLVAAAFMVRPLMAQAQLPPIAQGESAETCLRITEFLYDSTLPDDTHEWIELTNVCEQPLDISGYKVGDEESRNEREGMVRFPDGTVVEGGRSVIVAQSAVAFRLRWGFLPNFELQSTDDAVPQLATVAFVNGTIQLANGGDEVIVLDANNALVDGVSYGESAVIFAPGVAGVQPGESVERRFANCDGDVSADFMPQNQPNPGRVTFADDCPAYQSAETLPTSPPIGTLQGNGSASPLLNQTVTFEGVVTGFHEDRNASGIVFYTLFVQDMVGSEDGDPQTSDGLPVFLGRSAPQAQIGDHVRVTGQIVEFYGFTEVADDGVRVEVLASGNVLPSPIEINPRSADFEALEGMRVRLDFAAANVVGSTFDGCGFTVTRQDSQLERLYRRHADDPIGAAIPILYRSDVDCDLPNVKVGDEVSGLSGILIYNFDQFKVLVQQLDDVIVDVAPLPTLQRFPAADAGQMSVVTLNVENLFDGIDDTGDDAEPKLSEEALQVKFAKISHTLTELLHCPTIIALQEIEKPSLSQRLADEVRDRCGFAYTVVHLESADGRGIDLAFLLDERRVAVISAELSQSCTPINTGIVDEAVTCPTGQEPLFSRQPLVVDATIDGQPLTIINNHFKSKRGGELETGPRREAQAAYLRDLTRQRLDANGEAAIIVLGDFNDYEDSPPIEILSDGGLFNVLKRVPDELRYSFVFGGVSQLIDGILVSPALEGQLDYVSILHTNADFPDSLGDDISAENLPYRATDHDLPYAIFNVAAEPDGLVTPTVDVPPTPTAALLPEAPTTATSDMRPLLIGALLVVLAGAGGYWFGRKQI